jgi:hypothetical protein
MALATGRVSFEVMSSVSSATRESLDSAPLPTARRDSIESDAMSTSSQPQGAPAPAPARRARADGNCCKARDANGRLVVPFWLIGLGGALSPGRESHSAAA